MDPLDMWKAGEPPVWNEDLGFLEGKSFVNADSKPLASGYRNSARSALDSLKRKRDLKDDVVTALEDGFTSLLKASFGSVCDLLQLVASE